MTIISLFIFVKQPLAVDSNIFGDGFSIDRLVVRVYIRKNFFNSTHNIFEALHRILNCHLFPRNKFSHRSCQFEYFHLTCPESFVIKKIQYRQKLFKQGFQENETSFLPNQLANGPWDFTLNGFDIFELQVPS